MVKFFIVPVSNSFHKGLDFINSKKIGDSVYIAPECFQRDKQSFLELVKRTMDDVSVNAIVALVEDNGDVLMALLTLMRKADVGFVEVKDLMAELSDSTQKTCQQIRNMSYVCSVEVTLDEFGRNSYDFKTCFNNVLLKFLSRLWELRYGRKEDEGDMQFMLTISSVHIEDYVADVLNEEVSKNIMGIPVYFKADCGWLIFNLDLILEECNLDIIPKSLLDCIKYARNAGADVLCIDCDGSEVSSLPTYEWDE